MRSRIVRFEMVIVPLKVHYKSTLPPSSPRVMERFNATEKIARVVSLWALKGLSFPLTECFYEKFTSILTTKIENSHASLNSKTRNTDVG